MTGEENRGDIQKSYIWLARGGPPDKTVTIFKYKPARASDRIDGFKGCPQTGGYEGYDCALKRHGGIIHVGCFVHARRKFFEALKVSSQAKSASIGIKLIRKLYAVENELRGREPKLSDGDFVLRRGEKAVPAPDEFKAWHALHYITEKAETLLQEAVNYTQPTG